MLSIVSRVLRSSLTEPALLVGAGFVALHFAGYIIAAAVANESPITYAVAVAGVAAGAGIIALYCGVSDIARDIQGRILDSCEEEWPTVGDPPYVRGFNLKPGEQEEFFCDSDAVRNLRNHLDKDNGDEPYGGEDFPWGEVSSQEHEHYRLAYYQRNGWVPRYLYRAKRLTSPRGRDPLL